jgi:hypothetical protein
MDTIFQADEDIGDHRYEFMSVGEQFGAIAKED